MMANNAININGVTSLLIVILNFVRCTEAKATHARRMKAIDWCVKYMSVTCEHGFQNRGNIKRKRKNHIESRHPMPPSRQKCSAQTHCNRP